MNFWQSAPFAAGGSLMWEFFMENEPPSINDMLATTFGGIELGEITYRLSDLFIDNRSSGAERVGREVLAGILSPVRAFNRIISGEAWRHGSSKGRTYSSVPVNFIVTMGPRFLAEQEGSKRGTTSLNINFRIDYGNPFNDDFYSPYEWFRFNFGMDLFSAQPVVSQVNAIGALWGKTVWTKGPRSLSAGLFQHFDFYNSELRDGSDLTVPPYRIAAPAAAGGGLIYYKQATSGDKTDIYAELYANGVALGASLSDYMLLGERDYNLGSGYSTKAGAGIIYNRRLAFLLNMENYHIFTWKGYDPEIDWSQADPGTLNIQGDAGNARLTIFSMKLAYLLMDKWNITLTNRYFSRRTNYRYYPPGRLFHLRPDARARDTDLILTLQLVQIFHFLALQKLVDTFEMFRHFLVSEFINFGHKTVQEVSVMRNDDQRPVKVHQGLFQDIFRLHIQMVRRLVKNQQIDGFQQ